MSLTRDRAFLDLRSQAHLFVVTPASDSPEPIYRLDFSMEWVGIKFGRTFVLRPTGMSDAQEFHDLEGGMN